MKGEKKKKMVDKESDITEGKKNTKGIKTGAGKDPFVSSSLHICRVRVWRCVIQTFPLLFLFLFLLTFSFTPYNASIFPLLLLFYYYERLY